MASRKSHFRSLTLGAVILALSALPLLAQDDPDPNSPTPVLLTAENSARALTSMRTQTLGKSAFAKATKFAASEAFAPNTKVVLYVTNLDLLKGEGANAFRVYAEDKNSHIYRFPILDLRPNSGKPWIYELTIKLTDEIGYWEPPTPDGDLIIYVSWRGLASNSVLLGYGAPSGGLKANDRVTSAPLSQYSTKPAPKKETTATQDLFVGYKWSGDRARFLEQAAFGLSPGDDSQIRRIGLRSWLAYQFDQPYPSLGNLYPDIPLKPTTAPADCDNEQTVVPDVPVTCFRDTYTMYPIQNWFFREAFYGTPQLHHRVAWALSQIWVISGVDTQQSSWMITYHQQLSKNAFGNWRQLMSDVTLNPGMGNYLDMIRSTKTSPNENYPREVLQLFNVGLFMLNPDGTLQLDNLGNPIPTYDQNVVNNFTKVFTGWRDCRTVGSACPNNTVPGAPDYKDQMELVGANHDLTAKTLLSYPGSTTTNIAACSGCTGTAITTYANNSLNQALDNIYNHPNVAPMASKALIQQLVTSDPTPAYVGRVSAVFDANRANPTQLKEVIKAILLDPEARGDVKTDPRYGKLREPVQLLTNVLREFTVGGASASGQPPTGQSDGVVNGSVSGLGQNVFNSPTVFNYYQPNYIVPETTILGPEFGIYTTATSIGRANLFATYAFNGLAISLPNTPNGTKIDLTEAQAVSAADSTASQLLDYLNTRMLHGTMSSQMKNAILPAITAIAASNSLQRAQTAVYLVATSPQFQVQR